MLNLSKVTHLENKSDVIFVPLILTMLTGKNYRNNSIQEFVNTIKRKSWLFLIMFAGERFYLFYLLTLL